MRPHDEDLTPEEIGELGTLLVAERPRPTEAFAAELDAQVASRFAAPPSEARSRSWLSFLQRPLLPAAATTLAVGLIAVVVALDVNGGATPTIVNELSGGAAVSAPEQAVDGGAGEDAANSVAPEAGDDAALRDLDAAKTQTDEQYARRTSGAADPCPTCAIAPDAGSRKVERSANLALGTPADRVQDVADSVLATVARFDGIVDQSIVSSRRRGGGAQFALRFPSARLSQALAALSDLPDAHILSRTDSATDVNEAYVSIRRRLANERAERAGIVNALETATSSTEIAELQRRLEVVEWRIARTERAQRALDRRIDYSQVALDIRARENRDSDDGLTIGGAFDDAGRVLEVAAAVVVIAAAALVPLAVLLALAWPLTRGLQRRRREQALDAAA